MGKSYKGETKRTEGQKEREKLGKEMDQKSKRI